MSTSSTRGRHAGLVATQVFARSSFTPIAVFLRSVDVLFGGSGADLVDGGRGTDTMQFNGSDGAETMSLPTNGTHAVLLRDVGTIRMDFRALEDVNLDLSANGAVDGADTVLVNGTNRADRISVNAGGGNDRVAVSKDATAIIGVAVDFGTGQR